MNHNDTSSKLPIGDRGIPYDDGIRRSGRTIRCADKAIQTLFEKGEVQLIDHFDDGKDGTKERLSQYLLKIVEGRLNREHRMGRGVHYKLIKQGIYNRYNQIILISKS